VLLISLPHIARVVYVALAIVGDCSKAKKMKPIPVLTYHEVDKKSGRSKKMALIAVDASSAYMESIFKLPESNQHYYGLFNSETGKPYENIGQSLSTSSSEEIELIKPFAEMDLDDIQTAINNSIKKE
jgi:hypothetical protein